MTEEKENRSLLFHSLWRLAQIMSSGGFTIVYVAFYTASLSKENWGVYGVAITIGQLLQGASNFGLRQTVTRFIAKARGEKNPGHIREYIRVGFKVSLVISAAALLLTLAFTGVLTSFFDGRADRFAIVLLIGATTFLAGISLFLQGVLEGLAKFKNVMLLNFTLNLLQLGLLALLLIGELSVTKVLATEMIIMASSIPIYGLQVLKQYGSLPRTADVPPKVVRTFLSYGLPLFINLLGGFLYTQSDVLFVQKFLTVDDTANYFFMQRIFGFPFQALGAYIFVLNTEIAVCYGANDFPRIRALFAKSEKWGVFAGLAIAGAFYMFSFAVEGLMPEYKGAAHLIRLISPLIVIKCVAQIASGAFMISLGKVKTMAAFTVLGGLTNVALNLAFIPAFGVDGAVYSTLVGHSVVGMASFFFVIYTLRRHGARQAP
jgi:O-antigen/teichoic acid export membrane protein